jgi:hypothetical protein
MEALTWLHCLVAVSRLVGNTTNPAVANDDGDEGDEVAVLLMDRRLIKTKGRHLTSFWGGSVLLFLAALLLFPDSTVLAAVPPDALRAFTTLVRHALGFGRRFKLLFRSGSAGTPATATSFHSRCDAQGPTVTLIRDTDGNVFGGYTSVNWSSPAGCWVYFADPTAFLFTIVNPHGDPPALFPGKTGDSIICSATIGPCFAGLHVMFGAFGQDGHSNIGGYYVNSTRHSGHAVLTGAPYFTPAEVEVWGSADD